MSILYLHKTIFLKFSKFNYYPNNVCYFSIAFSQWCACGRRCRCAGAGSAPATNCANCWRRTLTHTQLNERTQPNNGTHARTNQLVQYILKHTSLHSGETIKLENKCEPKKKCNE